MHGRSVYLFEVALLAQNPPVELRRPTRFRLLLTLAALNLAQCPVEGNQSEVLLQSSHVVRVRERHLEVLREGDVLLEDLERQRHLVPKPRAVLRPAAS